MRYAFSAAVVGVVAAPAVPAAAAAGGAMGAVRMATAGGRGAAGCAGWSVLPSPDLAGWDSLRAVTATSATGAWAVGTVTSGRTTSAMAQRWDGRSWRAARLPDGTYHNVNELDSVAADSPRDVWAVGRSMGPTHGMQPQTTLAEHWDGRAWSVVPTPVRQDSPQFASVAALSPADVWAVGDVFNTSQPPYGRTLTEHFDGRSWRAVPSPNPGPQDDSLDAVAAVSPNDVWAVGNASPALGVVLTLAEHWDGRHWRVVPTPNVPGSGFTVLESIAARSASDIWTAGFYDSNAGYGSLFEHWDGKQWHLVTAPLTPGGQEELPGLVTVGTDQAWAVGGFEGTLTEHWAGHRWVKVPSPDPGSFANFLSAVTAVPRTGQLLAVGYQQDSGHPAKTLVLSDCVTGPHRRG
ncbi:MAG TPA: hypothetical protein VGS19_21615 [Streptosporangiaceae bacterium]|nr:hypothetical protein [Streptosporangiaceae bacterium]